MTRKSQPKHHNLLKHGAWRWVALAGVLVGAIVLATVTSKTSAASATLSFSPSSGSYNVGDTITVAVNENSGSDSVNSVQADFTYSSSLQFVSIDGNSSGFGVAAPSSGGSGSVSISRGALPAVSGQQLVANVTFQVISANPSPATLTFGPVCNGSNGSDCIAVVMASNSGSTDIASASSGASFTLQNATVAPTCPSGTTGTYPNCVSSTPPSSPPPPSSTTKSTSSSTKSTSSSTTSSNGYSNPDTVSPVAVSNNGQIKVTQPVNVQPATIQLQGVKEVDYYLNGKLVYVSKTPPYTYHINTTHMLNGTYSMLVKTIYTNGRTSSSTQKLYVANPFSMEQLWLFIKKYFLLPIILIVVAVIIWRSIVHLRKMGYLGGNSSDQGGIGVGTVYSNQSAPPVIRPSGGMVSQTVPVEESNSELNQ